jgi:hypothetical protein
LGDGPGIFADAAYSGLCVEFPVMVRKVGAGNPDSITLHLFAENIKVFDGYPGHLVRVFKYQETGIPCHWKRSLCQEHRWVEDQLRLDIGLAGVMSTYPDASAYISISVEVDTEVTPGLYNNFVITSLRAFSDAYSYAARFGFGH